jgi:hypothetical protein
MMAVYFGSLNVLKFKVRDDRRGRPKGTTGARHKDDAHLQLMARIATVTGVTRPRPLARLAVEIGNVPLNGASKDSVVKRLAGRWKQSRGEIIS